MWLLSRKPGSLVRLQEEKGETTKTGKQVTARLQGSYYILGHLGLMCSNEKPPNVWKPIDQDRGRMDCQVGEADNK